MNASNEYILTDSFFNKNELKKKKKQRQKELFDAPEIDRRKKSA